MTDAPGTQNDVSDGVIRFGGFTFDTNARELRKNGELVALEPKVFALLSYLIEQRHRAVNKDEIQDTVWAGTIVSETALTRAIMKARRAVDDSADTQTVIRTVHGHGYQFIATLDDSEPAAEAPLPESSSNRVRLIALAFVVTLITFSVYLWPDKPVTDDVHLAIMPVENLTNDNEYEWVRLGLLGFAGELVSQTSSLSVVRSSDAIRFAETNGLPDDETAAEDLTLLNEVYGASHLLRTRLEQNAGSLRLSYTLHAADGSVERGTMVGAEPTTLLKGMINRVAGSLDDSAGNDITMIAEDAFINEAYSRALAYSLEGRCGDALQLFEVVKSSTESITRAHYEWADCARILGRTQEAEDAFKEIIDTLPVEPATSLRAIAHHGLGTVYIRSGRGELAQQTLEDGLQIAKAAGDRITEGKIYNNLAIHAKDKREYDEARALIARANVAYADAGQGMLPGQLPAALANIDMAEGKLDAAEDHLTQALETFRATNDRRNEAMMLNNFGYLRRIQGRIGEAEPLHLESLAIRREIGDRVGQGRILGMLSILYVNEQRYDDAKAAASEAFEIASGANDQLFMGTAKAQLAQAEFSAGDLDAARAAYAESKAIFEGIDDLSRGAQVNVRLARIDIRAEDLESAKSRVDDIVQLARREALYEPLIEAMELDGDISVLHEKSDEAIDQYRQTLEEIDETGFVVTKDRVTRKLVKLLLDANDLSAAEPLIGGQIEKGETPTDMRLRARFTYLQGDAKRAAEILDAMQSRYADYWTTQDDEQLAAYREAAGSST